ncbi:hypothetical protein THER5_1896 [Bifidobacterium thermacidophilum subsp. thermacidophilum]|uniref:Uncharacterized protein n=1 Tax=Bifidobacterium thermacidophilum subsp. thermacidophilum TaxID=79262 RepID=A0A087E253_9BIFI|nr:hypothetical protein THER5_1896 [Bifidobacterium thermacidophilum subsp. thermacidophilum]
MPCHFRHIGTTWCTELRCWLSNISMQMSNCGLMAFLPRKYSSMSNVMQRFLHTLTRRGRAGFGFRISAPCDIRHQQTT